MTEPGAMTKTLNIRMDPTMFLRLPGPAQSHEVSLSDECRRQLWARELYGPG